jgi:Tol biopolymer transport system component
VEVLADDLSSALVWAYDLPGVADDTPLQENLYVEDTATRGLRTVSVSQQDPLALTDFLNTDFRGYSADAKHVAFVSSTRMLPDAALDVQTPGTQNVYKWDDGVLSVVGVLPDGSVPPAGATVSPANIKGTMSADGSRLIFSASPDGSAPSQLYLHVDGKPSVWVSQPERGDGVNGDMTPAGGVLFEGMTPDGNNVFFSSEESLVDADTAPGPDEYRYTYSAGAGHHLTLITNDGQAHNDPGSLGGALVGISDDARRVYLHEVGGTLKLWQEGVAGLTTADPSVSRTGPSAWMTLVASMPGYGRVSPDGDWLAYITDTSQPTKRPPILEGKLYLYDRRAGSLVCASCPSDASVEPAITDSGQGYFKGFRPRFLSDKGQVFFTSAGALVPSDTNGVSDVYEYDGPSGKLALVTTGKGSEPAELADASASGDDVFVVTRQRLVPADTDDYVDVYDVRVGPVPADGSLTTARACEGDGCQALPSAPPVKGSVATSLVGGGSAAAPVRTRLSVTGSRTFRGRGGSLRVSVSRGGRLRWSGAGLVGGLRSRTTPGTITAALRLSRAARRTLQRSGRYVTTVRLRLVAADGMTDTARARVTFKSVTTTSRGR